MNNIKPILSIKTSSKNHNFARIRSSKNYIGEWDNWEIKKKHRHKDKLNILCLKENVKNILTKNRKVSPIKFYVMAGDIH